MATVEEAVLVTPERSQTDIAPFVGTNAGYMIAPRPLVYVSLALGALLARLLDDRLRRFILLLTLPVPTRILVARLTLVPGHIVHNAVSGLAANAFELGTRFIVDLTRLARRREAPPKVGNVF